VNPRRLYRCRHDRILAGVASGMAEYLGLDPTVVRILWLLSTLFGGLTILLYIILAFIMPLEPAETGAPGAPGTTGWTGWGPSTGEAGTEPGADAAPATAPGAAPVTGWGAAPVTGWGTSTWHNPPHEHRPGRMGLYLGVMLVVFGTIAMANVLIPGLVGGGLLGAGFLVALGVALLVGATRPNTADR
jgi:phage shock protein PspC (stress-responsive transcriptional regulator)